MGINTISGRSVSRMMHVKSLAASPGTKLHYLRVMSYEADENMVGILSQNISKRFISGKNLDDSSLREFNKCSSAVQRTVVSDVLSHGANEDICLKMLGAVDAGPAEMKALLAGLAKKADIRSGIAAKILMVMIKPTELTGYLIKNPITARYMTPSQALEFPIYSFAEKDKEEGLQILNSLNLYKRTEVLGILNRFDYELFKLLSR